MAINIQYVKVPIFEDVNDIPVAPTATTAGNGSHLVEQYNNFVDETEGYINSLSSGIDELFLRSQDSWIVVNDDYPAAPGDKIVFNTFQPIKVIYYLDLPSSPPLGTSVTFINTNASVTVELRNFQRFNGGYEIRLYIQDQYIERTIIFVGGGIGWLPTTPANYLAEYGTGT